MEGGTSGGPVRGATAITKGFSPEGEPLRVSKRTPQLPTSPETAAESRPVEGGRDAGVLGVKREFNSL